MTGSKPTVLLCDDDRVVLTTLAEGLSHSGFTVFECDSGDDAILLARSRRPDIALLDLRMQGKSGMDVAGYLRDVLGIPFLFLSAFSDPDSIAQAINLGALGYLVKPLELTQIVPELRLALERSRLEKSSLPSSATETRGNSVVPNPDNIYAIAIGLLMGRFGIAKARACVRLASLASASGVNELEAARQLVEQHETLGADPQT